MEITHEIILISGILCLLAIFAGLFSSRIGTPILLVFIAVGMLAGEEGPGGISFNNFQAAYLVGSIALAAIMFHGGLHTKREMIRQAFWPSLALATVGVGISASLVALAARWMFDLSWPEALLLGAATAPTDAAAVSVLLQKTKVAVPSRVISALELESGLNDPMSVFLTVGLVQLLTSPAGLSAAQAGVLFAREVLGGAVLGAIGGYAMLLVFRRITSASSVFPVIAVGGALALFGAAQVLEASGFLAVYLAGMIVGNYKHRASAPVSGFFDALGWLAQITLFLMLGLLVNPHELLPHMWAGLLVGAVLILVARPTAVAVCLLPFRWRLRETAFVAWVGLRGAVPIFLTIIPLLAGVGRAHIMFNVIFLVVIVSVSIQGWTIKPAARLLRLRADP